MSADLDDIARLIHGAYFDLVWPGDIMSVDIIGQPIVIINSRKIAKELMDGRSSLYSDRPHFVSALLSNAANSVIYNFLSTDDGLRAVSAI